MPGIVGLITRMPRKRAEQNLLRMVESVRHESFYRAGTWVDEEFGVYVGWTAHQNSFAAEMPLCNERGDVRLIFSGEEYPESGIARRLKERGHTLDDKGPCYLVHLYEEDPLFPAVLNGRFDGLLTDLTSGTAKVVNDRFGMHRLYYHESNNGVYFAAEAKAILAVCPELRKTDPRGLGEFVACGCVLQDRTLFEGLHVLPPASAWVCRGGPIEQTKCYFQPREWEDQYSLAPES